MLPSTFSTTLCTCNECNRCAFYASIRGGRRQTHGRDPEVRKLRTTRRPRGKKLVSPASAYAYGWLRCVYSRPCPPGIQDMRSRGSACQRFLYRSRPSLPAGVYLFRSWKGEVCMEMAKRQRWIARSGNFAVLPFEWNIFWGVVGWRAPCSSSWSMEVGILWVYWMIDRYRLAKEKKNVRKTYVGRKFVSFERGSN